MRDVLAVILGGTQFNSASLNPIYSNTRFLPGTRLRDCTVSDSIVAEGCSVDRAEILQSVVGIRTTIQAGAVIRRSVLLGADYTPPTGPPP